MEIKVSARLSRGDSHFHLPHKNTQHMLCIVILLSNHQLKGSCLQIAKNQVPTYFELRQTIKKLSVAIPRLLLATVQISYVNCISTLMTQWIWHHITFTHTCKSATIIQCQAGRPAAHLKTAGAHHERNYLAARKGGGGTPEFPCSRWTDAYLESWVKLLDASWTKAPKNNRPWSSHLVHQQWERQFTLETVGLHKLWRRQNKQLGSQHAHFTS